MVESEQQKFLKGLIELTTQNEMKWVEIEEMAKGFHNTTDEMSKDDILSEIYLSMERYIDKSAETARFRAVNTGVEIPKEDFISYYGEALILAARRFDPSKGTFKGLVSLKFHQHEIMVWRNYETKGEVNDKNGKRYDKGRCLSLDKQFFSGNESESTLANVVLGETPSAEETFLEDNETVEILQSFVQQNEKYAHIISLIHQGYEGGELAQELGMNEYTSSLRKTVQRSRDSFKKFMADWASQ